MARRELGWSRSPDTEPCPPSAVARIEPEPSDFDPDSFDEQARERSFAAGIAAFDAARFHEAHESFEQCWLGNEGGDADFYKGLVQASICMFHLSRANLDGARPLNIGARRLLGSFLPEHRGLELSRFLGELHAHVRCAFDPDGGPVPVPKLGPVNSESSG